MFASTLHGWRLNRLSKTKYRHSCSLDSHPSSNAIEPAQFMPCDYVNIYKYYVYWTCIILIAE